MLHEFANWLVALVSDMGYLGIILLMAVESSAIPFPSEVVMIPAGYLVFKGEMNIILVVLSGILGSLIGALANYFLALWVGRAFLLRYGKYFFVGEKSLHKNEKFFEKHGAISTFIGRLLPGIRQLISIPAGLAKMRMPSFLFFTSLGAGIWCTILTVFGYFIGQQQELIEKYLPEITIATISFCVLIAVGYIFLYRNRKKII
jgi:membrane protein DedA with SNARE-associated domain